MAEIRAVRLDVIAYCHEHHPAYRYAMATEARPPAVAAGRHDTSAACGRPQGGYREVNQTLIAAIRKAAVQRPCGQLVDKDNKKNVSAD